MKYCVMVCICVLSLSGLLSCGLEAVAYIDYIPPGNVFYNSDTNTYILLPSSVNVEGAEFDNYIIFYRIYISSEIVQTGRYLMDDSSARSNINATFNSDYINLYSFTDTASTNVNTSNLENTFSNRRYFLLTLVNADGSAVDINHVLNSGASGQRLDIAFPMNDKPALTIGAAVYDLQRAVRNETLNPPLYDLQPLPDRRFLNHSELYNTANVTSGRNADVATLTGSGTPLYTYVSMYIAARGTSLVDMPPRTVYSQPTFIGIFQLAGS